MANICRKSIEIMKYRLVMKTVHLQYTEEKDLKFLLESRVLLLSMCPCTSQHQQHKGLIRNSKSGFTLVLLKQDPHFNKTFPMQCIHMHIKV